MKSDEYEKAFKALANEQRLKIMYLLYCVDDKATVSELAHVFQDSESNSSRQLKILKEAGFLEKHRAGKWTYYSVGEQTDKFLFAILDVLAMIPEEFVAQEIERCKELISQGRELSF